MTITATPEKALLPSLSHRYNKPSLSVFSLLRRAVSKSVRFMDSLLFPNDYDDFLLSTPFDHSLPPLFSDPGESIFLVPFRWWKEAVCGGGFEGMDGVTGVAVRLSGTGTGDSYDSEKVIGAFDDSEILVGMRREGEAQVSGEEGVSGVDGDLALVSDWMFFTAIKWHCDNEDVESLLHGDDIFSLKIRLMYMRESRHLVIKISQKDNEVGIFNKARSIFSTESGSLHIWDFSGQTNQLFVGDNKYSMDIGQPDEEEVRMELQIYGLPYTINDEERHKETTAVEQSWIIDPSSSSPLKMNANVGEVNLFSRVMPAAGSVSNSTGPLGLTGLYNLGNTCFMNSAIQCLVHTPKLVDYFLGNFRRDLNFKNPLGMNGKLAIAFGDLLRKLWAPGATPVTPRMFKSTLASFAPQFSGYNQHDSQEILSLLLDGLHEDLNRVKIKPYIEAKDEDGCPHEEVADKYWENHLSRNDSIIVDLCQGQYRSTLVCPVCKKLSITFDPFMYLSLPLSSSTLRKMTLTVLSTDGTTLPHPVTVRVPDKGTFKDLVEALVIGCSLRDDESLLIAEIFGNSILRILDDLDDSIELIRGCDRLVAYRLPKAMDGSPLVEFIHRHEDESHYSFSHFKKFGIPLVARMPDFSRGLEIRKKFLDLINPFLLPAEEFLTDDASQKSAHEEGEVMKGSGLDEDGISDNEFKDDSDALLDYEFCLGSHTDCHLDGMQIQMDKPVAVSQRSDQRIEVLVSWPQKMIQKHDTSILSLLPSVCETDTTSRNSTQNSISLYNCMDAFLKEEPLGPDDMWYCPNCKEHRQASKKLDLWRLPEILVIHLKRFSYTRYLKKKLETFVDFPVDVVDLSNYITLKNNTVCNRYMLYAVSNHYGGMGGGHYTAFAKHRLDKWYEFDDSHVLQVSEEQIKTQAAYVLFYKRI